MKKTDLINHIKRKTVDSYEIPDDQAMVIKELDLNLNQKFKFKDVKDFDLFIVYDKETVRCFNYNDQGNACAIPIADPVLLYFNMAQNQLRVVIKLRDELLASFRNGGGTSITETSMNTFYQYFGCASSLVTMAMTSIEAFINQKLPPENLQVEKNKFTEVYTKDQGQRWLSFDDKIKLINKHYKKDYSKSPHYSYFINLKNFRDDIIHTKIGKDGYQQYSDLYKKALNFKFNESLIAVKEFINLFSPKLIEDCPCGNDF